MEVGKKYECPIIGRFKVLDLNKHLDDLFVENILGDNQLDYYGKLNGKVIFSLSLFINELKEGIIKEI